MENNGKIPTSAEPNKICNRSKGFDESYLKMSFLLLNLSHCVQSYGHLCQIYHNNSPNMVMSCYPGFKFRKFLFWPNSILNFWKSNQIWGKLAQEQKSYRQKKQIGLWKTPPPQWL